MSHNYAYNLLTQSILDVGVLNQIRAGRELVATDFTALPTANACGLGLGTPIGLWDAGSLTNLGSGGNLVNKNSTALTGKGVNGTANHAAVFDGTVSNKALYIADTGAADLFRIKTGSWGCWFRTAKRGTFQCVVTKYVTAAGQRSWQLNVTSANVIEGYASFDGTATSADVTGSTDVCDDRWHFAVVTFDGSVLRIYVDGVLEASVAAAGTIFAGTAPFNVGGANADSGAAVANPFYGRVAVPFVTADVLSEDQIRFLMCAKVAHGFSVIPGHSSLMVRRKHKGGPFVVGDYSASPRRLYNFTAGAITDAGLDAQNLSLSAGSTVSVAGADGQSGGALSFAGATYYGAAITGLPTGTAARSIGCWFRTTQTGLVAILDYGVTAAGAGEAMVYLTGGQFAWFDGVASVGTTSLYNDGQWHFGVVTADNAAVDGVKVKLYVDGKLNAELTSIAATGTTAGSFVLGTRTGGTNYWVGGLDGVFITDYAMAEDEILSLYAKGSVALPASEKAPGDHIEAMDATNLYVLFGLRDDDDSTLDSQHSVDLKVAA